jgi:hypothetical protein
MKIDNCVFKIWKLGKMSEKKSEDKKKFLSTYPQYCKPLFTVMQKQTLSIVLPSLHLMPAWIILFSNNSMLLIVETVLKEGQFNM